MTVEEILAAPAAVTHECLVRSVAPAVVIVLEVDAPARLEILASNEAEEDALAAWSRESYVRELLRVYFEATEGEEEREDAHAARLESGPLTGLYAQEARS